jgi:DNA-binding NarL/FixJ family response regulator
MRETAESIRAVAVGTTVVPSGELNLTRASPVATSVPPQAAPLNSHFRFTRRQMEILACLWAGKPNKLIAHELNLSQSTVKVHIRIIMKKLHATNRTQVVLLSRPV